jgi:bifunctional enzyme CysN/CysC
MVLDQSHHDDAQPAHADGEPNGLLRFITCGSVDDGKSTLIGRLLYDTKLLFDDQLVALERDSLKHGTVGDDMDFALLVDGLEAEREQGITIDVAYRFFNTKRRKFIVADTPGHEQYTRNMATGASTADLAIVLIDARKGVLTQTRRHSYIASLLGIRHVVLAINKIDLVGYSQSVFEAIRDSYTPFARQLTFDSVVAIPISARFGDNVLSSSPNMPWYRGPTLLDHLETAVVSGGPTAAPFSMPVQLVNRPHSDFRGFSGTIAAGAIVPGDRIVVAGSGQRSRVGSIITFDGNRERAEAGESVTLTLDDEIDISRGDVLAAAENRPAVSDQFCAHLIATGAEQLFPGRPYFLKLGTRTVSATISEIKHRIDVNTFEKLATKSLHTNEIAVVNMSTQEPIAFASYADNKVLGAFILIDKLSNQTVAAGMIDFGLRRATNIHWQTVDVTKQVRARVKHQKPAMLWFTGLSGAGKSTVANLVEKRLTAMGRHTYLLDGDNVRHGLCRDLGFTDVDRVENIRRVAEAAKLMVDAGLIVLAAFISPFRAERRMARELLDPGEFIEIFVDTPLNVAEGRDPKGLYRAARAGRLVNFTGIDSPYEPPEHAELVLAGDESDPEALADKVIAYLESSGHLATV